MSRHPQASETVLLAKSASQERLLFFDLVRNMAMLSVIVFHAAGAYSGMAPYWVIQDGTSTVGDAIRQVFDVFMMPTFFFVSGYFALSSIQHKDVRIFLLDKVRRIAIPWLIAILVVVPLIGYMGESRKGEETAFGSYFAAYLGTFGDFFMGSLKHGDAYQMHFWFLSLLMAFLVVFALGYSYLRKAGLLARLAGSGLPASAASIVKTLAIFVALASAVCFAAVLLVPDTYWIVVGLLLQFQVTRVLVYAAYFGLGVFVFSRRWFAGEAFPDRPVLLSLAAIALGLLFVTVGQAVFSHPSDSQLLSPAVLGAFSVARSIFCVAFVVAVTSIARRWTNRPWRLNQRISAASFDVYLYQLFFVLTAQGVLTEWRRGPAAAKIGIVVVLAFALSYGLSCAYLRTKRRVRRSWRGAGA